MPILIGIVVVIGVVFVAAWLVFAGTGWVAGAAAALVAVPSIVVLRPIYFLVGPNAVGVVYIVFHAALGAFAGWWIGRRAAGATGSDQAWPGSESRRNGNDVTPGAQSSGLDLPQLPWDVRLQNAVVRISRRLRVFYDLYPRWAWGIGLPLALLAVPLLYALVASAWPLLLIGTALLGGLIYRSRRSRSSS